jgi:hypothetical protein
VIDDPSVDEVWQIADSISIDKVVGSALKNVAEAVRTSVFRLEANDFSKPNDFSSPKKT